jgi:flagellar basal-body rod protein FlgC
MDINALLRISAAGMEVQSTRLRVTAENIANAQSTATVPGGDPYRRKTVSFENALNRELGVDLVGIKRYGEDLSDFELRYDPNHPAADINGNVKLPNVNPLIELMDMREAQRSYEANLSSLETAKSMASRLLELLR